jgi:hypothetical protein
MTLPVLGKSLPENGKAPTGCPRPLDDRQGVVNFTPAGKDSNLAFPSSGGLIKPEKLRCPKPLDDQRAINSAEWDSNPRSPVLEGTSCASTFPLGNDPPR